MDTVLVIAGIVSNINHALSFAAVVTAALTGTARYSAALTGDDPRRLERATAYGLFLGGIVAVFLLGHRPNRGGLACRPMFRRLVGPTLIVVSLILASVLTLMASDEESNIAAAVLILLMMIAGTGVGLTVTWSDRRH